MHWRDFVVQDTLDEGFCQHCHLCHQESRCKKEGNPLEIESICKDKVEDSQPTFGKKIPTTSGDNADKGDNTPLEDWVNQLKQCKVKEQVFALLDKFRLLPWSDQERATVSQAYIRRLDYLQQRR